MHKILRFRLIKKSSKIIPHPIKKFALKLITTIDKKINEILRKIIIETQRKTLREILKKEKSDFKKLIVFAPTIEWDAKLFQRPQQLALALGRKGALVFYLQPVPDLKQPPFRLIGTGLYLCNVYLEIFHSIPNPYVYLLTYNSHYASYFCDPRIIYDFIDDIDVFGDRDQLTKGHEYLLKNAYVVLATAKKLVEEVQDIRPDVIYSPNGVTYEHFSKAARKEYSSPPQDLASIINLSQPIIGYYGALARWFDYNLVKQTAILKPQYQFVLIGPDYDGTLWNTDVLDIPNIHWLGAKPYRELPHYLQYFDVAMIPFLVNEITNATSPIKLFEYMAGEKPVVITPMRESMHYPGVLTANTAEEFASQIDKALLKREDSEFRLLLRKIALENTWDIRAEEMLKSI